MFFHAYKSYMTNAFPADELMPLSCKGRYRNSEPSRGDIDDALGNFSLTLIDSLDTLFVSHFSFLLQKILNEFDEFERAVLNILDYVSLDTDVDVSVFETNIRVLGGLLGGHIAALELKTSFPNRMTWYDKQLLEMAVDAGNRLLPAFNTTTGLPYPRVNLNLGIGTQRRQETDTCTACAGTMILEFATLSRLTGNPIYEQKAARAMSYIWKQRNRFSDLVGTVINIHNGEWVRRESGVGAGIDSYYEYLWKAYGLLGEPVYLHRFQTHYSAVERYLGGFNSRAFPFSFLSVYMHRPSERSRNFMDALQAFWPGLQMNSGDMKAAVALHEMLYQVHRRHKLLPEAFTPDLDVHWAYHLLRPELIESTYLLYQATRDPYYLRVGADILESLNRYARVPCGFAAIKDIRTMEHTDQMDSFVLAETFKYLYLLFSEPSELPLDMSKYILSTEAHLLPIGLPPVKSVPGALSASQQDTTTNNASATSDFYIERDEQAEQLLHRTAQCRRPFAYGEELEAARRGHCPHSARAAGDADAAAAAAICLPDEGAGLPRLEATFRRLVGFAPSRQSSCSSSNISRSDEEALLWSRIEAIRRPLRKIASVMLARKNGSGAKPDSHQQQQQQTATRTPEPLISASEFRPDNLTHLQLIRRMGIVITPTLDGKLQLHLDQAQAETPLMGLLGITFLEQIIQMNQATPISEPSSGFLTHTVAVLHPPYYGRLKFQAGPSRFGLYPGEEALSPRAGTQTPVEEEEAEGAGWPDDLTAEVQESAEAEVSSRPPRTAWRPLAGPLVIAEPYDACSTIRNFGLYAPVPSGRARNSTAPQSESPVEPGEQLTDTDSDAYRGPVAGAIALVTRGGCMFLDKARNLKEAGAVGGIIIDNTAGTSAAKHQLFSMSGDAPDDHSNGTLVSLPFVFLFNEEGETLRAAMTQRWRTSQQPAIGLISKEDDSPRIFSHALKALDASSEADGDTCYDILTTLKKEEAPTVCHSSRFFVSALVPGDTQESGWQLSLLPDAVEEGHLVFKAEDGDQYYSKDPTAWSTLIDRQWPVSENTSDCKDLILAMIEAVLSHTTDRESSLASDSPVVVSQNWISRINDCLLPMSVLQSVSDNCGERKPSSVIQLSVSFRPTTCLR
ncbi:ER degradation-enhancing alpha-mannosidase-like protein 3 [Sparganum proliferum]